MTVTADQAIANTFARWERDRRHGAHDARSGLPPLAPTTKLTPPKPGTAEHRSWSRVHRMPPGPRRAIERAATFPGLAEAAADQWGGWALEDERNCA